MEMMPPTNIKEVQSLNGKVAALNRFKDLKSYLSSPSLLSPSKPGEELFLYLAVYPTVVSTTLVREEDKVQKPIYYIS